MFRTVVNTQTGEVAQVELTEEEVKQAEAAYAAWLESQPKEEE